MFGRTPRAATPTLNHQLQQAAIVSRQWDAWAEANNAVRTGSAPLAVDHGPQVSTGASYPPPKYRNGSGTVYLVTPRMMINGADAGPALLMIKENNGEWNPPGGGSKNDKHVQDKSLLETALREFTEELGGIDWRRLDDESKSFQLVRLKVSSRGNQSWAMLVDLEAQACEKVVFSEDRSAWKLSQRMHKKLDDETDGYAFVPLSALLAADQKTKTFMIGPYRVKLRTFQTLQAVKEILSLPGVPNPPTAPAPAPASGGGGIEEHAIHLRITPGPASMANADVRAAIASQLEPWGGLHVTITGFALRQKAGHLTKTKEGQGCAVHGGSLTAFVAKGARLLTQKGPWHPSDLRADGKKIRIKSHYLALLEQAARNANLAEVKPADDAHVSIGEAKYAPAVLAALKDPATRWTLGIAVITLPGCFKGARAQFARVKDEQPIWP